METFSPQSPLHAPPPPGGAQPPRRAGVRRAAVLLWGGTLLGLAAIQGAHLLLPVLEWDVAQRGQAGQLAVFNSVPDGGFFGLPVEMGDYDGDGKLDLAIAPMAARAGPGGGRERAGQVYLYRGEGTIEGSIDRKAMEGGPAGLTLWGARAEDFLGTELYTADFNGDGIADLVVGAQNHDGPDGTRTNAGAAFVVLGRPGLLPPAGQGITLDMAQNPPGVVVIAGRRPGERLGVWVEAGDLDGDGMAELLLGADQTNAPALAPGGPERPHAGAVVVVYGRREFPALLDLADPAYAPGAASGVSVIQGDDTEDHFGSCIHARDLDRDGFPEIIAAAALNRLSAGFGGTPAFPAHSGAGADGPDERRFDCGQVWVLFGAAGRLPPVLDLAVPSPEMAARLTTFHGAKGGEALGEEIATGDLDGDGYPDLALGALAADGPQGEGYAGAVRIVYWRPGLRGISVDFDAPEQHPPGLVTSEILGLESQEILGDTLSTGDFNHDGIDDLAVGIPHHPISGDRAMGGEVAVIFGRSEPFPPRILPNQPLPSLQVAYVHGAESLDLLSYSMEARDYDGDGYTDLFPNAMRGDGADDDRADAGEAYLISGFHLTAGRVEVEAVEPRTGPINQEAPVVVVGVGFTRDDDTRVLVDGAPAREVRVLSGTRISCVLPARPSPGAVSVAVENRYGLNTLASAFRYLDPHSFVRGDSDGDLSLAINDPLLTLGYLFMNGQATCLDRHDSNDDGRVDISDPLYTLFALFAGGPAPPVPYPDPGPDPSLDDLECS